MWHYRTLGRGIAAAQAPPDRPSRYEEDDDRFRPFRRTEPVASHGSPRRSVTRFMGKSQPGCGRPSMPRAEPGHLFFDELDAIGSQRGFANDVGERVLNSFLQMIGQDRSHGLVVAPTNRPDILDHALFRRFDDIFHHDLPDKSGSRRCRASREFPSGASGGASSPSSPSDLTARTVDEVRRDAVGHARIGESDI